MEQYLDPHGMQVYGAGKPQTAQRCRSGNFEAGAWIVR